MEENTTFDAWLNHVRNYVLMQLEKRRANSKEKEIEEMKKDTKFKVGDKVVSRTFGTGTIDEITDLDCAYPVVVKWDNGSAARKNFSTFTLKGRWDHHRSNEDKDIKLLEGNGEEVEDNTEEELKVGDWVWLNPNEKGIVTFIYPDKDTCIVDSELDGEVEAVMAGLTKVEYSPINPSHYQVAGIPEAIEIMKHLMTKEQMEGFLWGNILKYAYRYGRKGDKVETAGKIAWYAKKLKELGECESK
nr:MAG TPA: nucelotide kinase [Caudoviricetes sp.]